MSLNRAQLKADVMAFGRDGRAILLVEIKTGHARIESAKVQIIRYLQAAHDVIPFAMLVTSRQIHIFKWDGQHLSEPAFQLDTSSVLSVYDAEYSEKDGFEYYMAALVEAWLRDAAYHWKSDNPPGFAMLEEIGIVRELQGGSTRTESPIE